MQLLDHRSVIRTVHRHFPVEEGRASTNQDVGAPWTRQEKKRGICKKTFSRKANRDLHQNKCSKITCGIAPPFWGSQQRQQRRRTEMENQKKEQLLGYDIPFLHMVQQDRQHGRCSEARDGAVSTRHLLRDKRSQLCKGSFQDRGCFPQTVGGR